MKHHVLHKLLGVRAGPTAGPTNRRPCNKQNTHY